MVRERELSDLHREQPIGDAVGPIELHRLSRLPRTRELRGARWLHADDARLWTMQFHGGRYTGTQPASTHRYEDHRDVREILQLVRGDGARFAGVSDPFDSMREVRPDAAEAGDRTLSLNQLERAAVREALNRSAGNRRRAADYLGISERTLYRKIKEYGLA